MPRISSLLIVGLLFTAPSESASPPPIQFRVPDPPRLRAGEDDVNKFVDFESQYCRPLLTTYNPQVVQIVHRFKVPKEINWDEEASWRCTGVVIGSRTVLTAKHCMELEKDGVKGELKGATVTTIDGQTFDVKLRSPDPRDDIMMLQVDRAMRVKPAKIAEKTSRALTLEGYGCIRNHSWTLPLQRSAISLYEDGTTLFISGCICHGDSGGPIFDDDGRLVALMFWTDNDGKNGRGVLVQNFLSTHSL